MSTPSRRDFLRAAATGAAAASILGARESWAAPLGMPIGFQSWPVRDLIGKDFKGTLEKFAGMGYQSVEMCSPPSYKGGYEHLIGMKAADMKKIINDAGLTCVSCHYNFRELKDHAEERATYAKELGLTQMIVAAFGLPAKATLDDWKQAAGDMNQIGEKLKPFGIQLGYHNHDMEFEKLDGKLIYDELMSVLDPKLVKMQFQVAVIRLGYKAATYFKKYPGRFISAHLADWLTEAKKQVAVGKGVVDWKKLFAAAKEAGIQNYFVEMDIEVMPDSAAFLRGLNV